MNSLLVTRYLSKFTICFADSLLNRNLFLEFTIHQNHLGLGLNQLFFRESTLNSLSISRTQFESALANFLRIMTHSRNHDGMLT